MDRKQHHWHQLLFLLLLLLLALQLNVAAGTGDATGTVRVEIVKNDSSGAGGGDRDRPRPGRPPPQDEDGLADAGSVSILPEDQPLEDILGPLPTTGGNAACYIPVAFGAVLLAIAVAMMRGQLRTPTDGPRHFSRPKGERGAE